MTICRTALYLRRFSFRINKVQASRLISMSSSDILSGQAQNLILTLYSWLVCGQKILLFFCSLNDGFKCRNKFKMSASELDSLAAC